MEFIWNLNLSKMEDYGTKNTIEALEMFYCNWKFSENGCCITLKNKNAETETINFSEI